MLHNHIALQGTAQLESFCIDWLWLNSDSPDIIGVPYIGDIDIDLVSLPHIIYSYQGLEA